MTVGLEASARKVPTLNQLLLELPSTAAVDQARLNLLEAEEWGRRAEHNRKGGVAAWAASGEVGR